MPNTENTDQAAHKEYTVYTFCSDLFVPTLRFLWYNLGSGDFHYFIMPISKMARGETSHRLSLANAIDQKLESTYLIKSHQTTNFIKLTALIAISII